MTVGSARAVTIRGVTDFLKEVLDVEKDWQPSPAGIWYRGVRNASYPLVPSAVWGSWADEDSIIEDFLISYRPIHGEEVADPWELYGLMAHFGMPTRLLDWTKSPLMGLYFALEDDASNPEEVDRAVWVIDPYEFNKATTGREEVFVPRMGHGGSGGSGIEVHRYLPSALRGGDGPPPEKPIALEPPLVNKRILAQQGCFTVHGSDKRPIDEHFFGAEPPHHIAKFLIPKDQGRQLIRQELHTFGIREDGAYQDLTALVERIKREWFDRSTDR